ncbi:MAG: tRNA (adenosine(37)-N6)-threonylcarbamoyltransferase complex transferase subunit TsaD [Thermomicrobiales bacterium]
MNILGIETSCDETAAAVVVDGREVRSNVIATQLELHAPYGGVVPELAARGQLRAIVPVIREALGEASMDWPEIDAIAVTQGPGLAGSLLVGVNIAKTLAYTFDKPLIAVNHLEAHIYGNWVVPEGSPWRKPQFPAVVLLVSGGHTELILARDHGDYVHLGQTLDDAAGEAFDKGARLLGLGYPGGPAIARAAMTGDPARFPLPRAWLGDESWDFSFSGLKTALLRLVEPWRLPAEPVEAPEGLPFTPHTPPVYADELPLADLAAAFQDAVIDVLTVKAVRAASASGAKTLMLAGGVAANALLRERIEMELELLDSEERPRFMVPPADLCTDNAAMVAAAGYYVLRRGMQAGWEFDVDARLPLVGQGAERGLTG